VEPIVQLNFLSRQNRFLMEALKNDDVIISFLVELLYACNYFFNFF